MASILLDRTAQATPDDKIIKNFWGECQIICTVYGSPVQLQVRPKDGTWMNAKFQGSDIQLTAQGDALDLRFAPDFEYRLTTTSPGSEVMLSTYTFKHNPSP